MKPNTVPHENKDLVGPEEIMNWITINPEILKTPPATEILDEMLRPVDLRAVTARLRAIRPDLSEETISKAMVRWPFFSIEPDGVPSGTPVPSPCRG